MTTFNAPDKYDRPAWGFWNELSETARCVEAMQREAKVDPSAFTDEEFVGHLVTCDPTSMFFGETVAEREKAYEAGMALLAAKQLAATRRMLARLGLATAEDARDGQ
jgi:hypothetical protein